MLALGVYLRLEHAVACCFLVLTVVRVLLLVFAVLLLDVLVVVQYARGVRAGYALGKPGLQQRFTEFVYSGVECELRVYYGSVRLRRFWGFVVVCC